jgi:copper transport protein
VRAGLVVLAVLLVPSAAAHALLAQSDPAAGARVERSPAAVHLAFTETVEPAGTHAEVLDANGTEWSAGQSFPARDRLDVALPPLANGTYAVHWTSLSVDGHTARSSFSFGVGPVAPSGAGAGDLLLHRHDAVDQVFLLLGLTASLGMAAFAGLVLPREAPAMERRGVLAVASLMAAAAFFGAMLVLGDGVEGSRLGLRFVTRTRAGLLWTLRAAALAVAVPLLWRHGRRAEAPPLPAAPLALLVGCALATSRTSHAAALASAPLANVALDALHLLAASLWFGGLLALGVWMPGHSAEEAGRLVRRFTPLAAGAVVVLVAAGVLRSVAQLHRLDALWTTSYGTILLVKVGLAAVVVGLGAAQRFRVGPGLVSGRVAKSTFQRLLGLEVVLLVAVLVATGLLTSAPPPAP